MFRALQIELFTCQCVMYELSCIQRFKFFKQASIYFNLLSFQYRLWQINSLSSRVTDGAFTRRQKNTTLGLFDFWSKLAIIWVACLEVQFDIAFHLKEGYIVIALSLRVPPFFNYTYPACDHVSTTSQTNTLLQGIGVTNLT